MIIPSKMSRNKLKCHFDKVDISKKYLQRKKKYYILELIELIILKNIVNLLNCF